MIKFNAIALLLIFSVTSISAQQIDKNLPKDEQIVREYFQSLLPAEDDSVHPNYTPDELMVKAALFLLDTPYVAHTLEGNKEEELVINLRELDCMTFVENCLALSKAAQYPYPDYEYFVRQLKEIRYREGILNGYTSRLHYTTDWITDNVSKGSIEDITYALGGKRFQTHVGFMSSHPESYSSLKNNPQDVEVMISIEKTINQRTTYYYIPQNEIKDKQSLIKSGDIICFTTSLSGLDISHLGIAYWNKSQLSFIHASTKYHKVVINPESLTDYCGMIKTNTGIMVLRPLGITNT
ncbi:xylanase [Bacteroidia bacterium]|nr:xylanase [Bacteroidia bacterium]